MGRGGLGVIFPPSPHWRGVGKLLPSGENLCQVGDSVAPFAIFFFRGARSLLLVVGRGQGVSEGH